MSRSLSVDLFLVVFALITVLIYYWFTKRFQYWIKKGVKGPAPYVPFGNLGCLFLRRKSLVTFITDHYFKYKKQRFCGIYGLHVPVLVITDYSLMHRLITTDMPYFESHGLPIDMNKNPLSGHLFNVSGSYWKNLRLKLSPTFTTGKIKEMFSIMERIGSKLQHLTSGVVAMGGGANVRELLERYTVDVIGGVALGLDCNSIGDEHSLFRRIAKRATNPTITESFRSLLQLLCPDWFVSMGLVSGKTEVINFFTTIITENVEYREKNKVVRNDFLDLLIKLKNNQLTDDEGHLIDFGQLTLSLPELTAQVFVFFVAGYETSASTGSFALYQLAQNREVQLRARREVLEVLKKHNGIYSYDALTDMEYLGNVINGEYPFAAENSGLNIEALRMYPPLNSLFRKCTADYTIPGTDVIVEKGTMVLLPIGGVHNDPELWPDPGVFDPDRFIPGRRPDNLNHIYMPFGQGPRICIGQRLGILQAKLALAKVLEKFSFCPCERTSIPMEYKKPGGILLAPVDGVWLNIQKCQD